MAIFIPVDVNATGAEFYTPERDTPGNKISYLLLMCCSKRTITWSIALYVRELKVIVINNCKKIFNCTQLLRIKKFFMYRYFY